MDRVNQAIRERIEKLFDKVIKLPNYVDMRDKGQYWDCMDEYEKCRLFCERREINNVINLLNHVLYELECNLIGKEKVDEIWGDRLRLN